MSSLLQGQLSAELSYFDIILPPTWSCINNINLSNYDGAHEDIIISAGDIIMTQQSSGCREQGDRIFVGTKSIKKKNFVRKFAHEWLKFRYGIFDTYEYQNGSNLQCKHGNEKNSTDCEVSAEKLEISEMFSTKYDRYKQVSIFYVLVICLP